MGKLRFNCYEEFAKRIEFPVVAFKAADGGVVIMNYEAKLMLGQKTQKITMDIEPIADSSRFWSQLHDRKAVAEHHLVLANEIREFAIAGLVNEFEVDGELMYMLIFEQRTGMGMNNWMLEQIIENSHVIFANVSLAEQEEVKVNYISRNIKRYGYTCEEFYTGKQKFKNLIHPDDLDLVLANLAERGKDNQNDDCMEYRLVTESRKVCYVRCNIHFLRDSLGKIESAEIVMVDITEEKLEKDENQYLRAAIEQSSSIVLVERFFNKKGTLKYISANAEDIGLDVEDLRKGRKVFIDYVLPEDQKMMLELLTNVQNMPVNNYTNRCRILGEDGVIRWIRFCISVKTIDEFMYDVELLMSDATEEKSYEQNLLQSRKELEERLDYVVSSPVQDTERLFEEFVVKEEVQDFIEAFAANNQLYAVVLKKNGGLLTKPTGPMIHLGEFYDLLERPKYKEKLMEALRLLDERKRFCILELESGYFERQIGAIPLIIEDEIVAACLICAFDEEAVARMHNSVESFQKMLEVVLKAEFNNRHLELDSRRSRLAERVMSEELKGQLILARAFAHMRNDARATMQEIIENTGELMHLTSIAVYYNDHMQEAYTCAAQWVSPESLYKAYPEQSWKVTELCYNNEVISNGGYIVYGQNENGLQLESLMALAQSRAIMVFGIVINEEVCGCIAFNSQEKRVFLDREIAYCRDVVDIIQGILARTRSTDTVYTLNNELLNAYNFVSDCVFVKDNQTGKVLFANEAMENLFGMDVTGTDSRSFLSVPTPTYTREGIQPIGDIKWQSYIQSVNKIMNIQELSIEWRNGTDAKLIIMRESKMPNNK
ncbi:MAG: PAS domain-containing protein [Bacteroides sp.]|nr:PAS domain-containing protein [Bacteroides sp.]MCM1549059.1 PAS domain-containing protein [Clostridium sp.]